MTDKECNRWAGCSGPAFEAPHLGWDRRPDDEHARLRFLAECVGTEWRRAPGRVTPWLRKVLDDLADLVAD